MRLILLFITGLFTLSVLNAQETDTLVVVREVDPRILDFTSYLGFVKRHHPVARQAELILNQGEAGVLKARGGFDPKVEVDYDRKVFKDTEYYDLLNGTFKIPTWFGIELKAQFEENSGVFLNPQNTVPDNGLYAAGISVPVGQGLWINERMATLRKARIYRQQSAADRDLAVNQVLYDASIAYFDWLKAYSQVILYEDFLVNARIRFEGIKKTALAGAIPFIDTTEAKIAVQTRELSLQEVRLEFNKAALELSNYLWIGDNIPIELQPDVIPDVLLEEVIDQTLEIDGIPLSQFIPENHPKLRSLGFKVEGLEVDRRLKANKLLPQIDINYNFLTTAPDDFASYDPDMYKGGVRFSVPLFLRKERGDLQLAKFKLQDARFELSNTRVTLQNKIRAVFTEIDALESQNRLVEEVVVNYATMVRAEERKFSVGESSVFLINTREGKLIDARLKQIELRNKFFEAKAKLFQSFALNPTGL